MSSTPQNGIPPVLVETISGLTAGLLSTLVAHPLDLIKVRLQVNRDYKAPRLGASWRIARDVAMNEGRGALYRGLAPNLVGNMTSWSLYFMLYGELKTAIAGYRGRTRDEGLDSVDYLLSSGSAGVLTAVLSNPLWVIKTRMLSTGRSSPGAYTSMTNGLRTIITTEGTRGLFRGLVPALFGVTHGALQFMFYERLKIWRKHAKRNIDPGPHTGSTGIGGAPTGTGGEVRDDDGGGGGEKEKGRALSNIDFLTLSAASKIMAGSITYPYRVVQTRMQTYDADAVYSSARDAVVKIWRNEGVVGFYKGLAPNLARVLPSTCITFLVYENTRYYLQ